MSLNGHVCYPPLYGGSAIILLSIKVSCSSCLLILSSLDFFCHLCAIVECCEKATMLQDAWGCILTNYIHLDREWQVTYTEDICHCLIWFQILKNFRFLFWHLV